MTDGGIYGANLSFHMVCKECRNPVPNLVEDFSGGQIVCGDCGLVLQSSLIDTRPEWRNFADDSGPDPSRVGGASDPLLDDYIDSTIIAVQPGNTNSSYIDMQRLHQRTGKNRVAEKLIKGFNELRALTDKMSLGDHVFAMAKQFLKSLEGKPKFRNQTPAVIAACLFAACRISNCGRSFKELSNISGVSVSQLGKTFKEAQKYFKDNGNLGQSEATPAPSFSSYTIRFCNVLDLKFKISTTATSICDRLADLGSLGGRSTVSIVGASIYFACRIHKENVSLAQIANVAMCAELTLKSAFRTVAEERFKLFDRSDEYYKEAIKINCII